MRVLIRADASTDIGAGHVMRCVALAEILVARGANVSFICRELPGHYCDWLEQRGFPVSRLDYENTDLDADSAQCQAMLFRVGTPDWLVVDHYGLGVSWETALRPLTRKIFAIDDNADRVHNCDLLLDQNSVIQQTERYSGLLPPGTQCLFGPRYALLRPEFADARAARHDRNGMVRRVLVCFGGSDPQGHTVATLRALRSHASCLEQIDVVVGLSNRNQAELAAVCAEFPNAVLHCQTDNMPALLAAADLAIGAGGTMNWERACLGLPTLAFGIADNQRQVLTSLIETGYVAGVPNMPSPDETLISAWLKCLLDNPALLRGLSERSATLVDGRGAKRVADTLFPAPLTFRPATLEDSDNLLNWRNDPAIRSVSLTSHGIDRNTHSSWLQKTLADPQRVLLIAEHEGRPAGVVRFDLHPQEAVISVYRVPLADSPNGLIRQATEWLRAQRPEIGRIRAEVLQNNRVSLAAFKTAGYRVTSNTLVFELDMP